MYSFFPCNEFHQVKSNMYVSALVCTSIHWYGQVHTSQELVCTGTDQYKQVHTGMYLHKRIYDIITTGIYWYSPTESVMYPFKKNVSKTRTRDFPHTVRRISPCTTRVYTLMLECWPFLFWVFIDICIICAPRAWCCIDGAGPAAPCWARNMWQFNNLYFTQLSRFWIHAAGETYRWALCAGTVTCPSQCYAWLMWDVSCASKVPSNRAWFLNFWRPG